MKRRACLLSILGTVPVAGCASLNTSDGTNNDDGSDAGQTETPAQSTATRTPEPSPQLQITNVSTDSSDVTGGKSFRLSYEVMNQGGTGPQTVSVAAFGKSVESTTVQLNGGSSRELNTTISTENVSPGTHTCTVSTPTSEATVEVTVVAPANLEIVSIDTPDVADQGETAPIAATVKNIGGTRGEQTLEYELGGEQIATRNLSIGPDRSRTVTHTLETDGYASGEYDVDISIGDSSKSATLSIERPMPDVNSTLSMPEPTIVDDAWSRSESEFSLTIENLGETGRIGYGIIISEDLILDPTEYDTSADSEMTLSAGETTEQTIATRPEPDVFFYEPVAWPARADVTVVNQNDVSGPVEIRLKRDGKAIAQQTDEIGAGGEIVFRIDLERSNVDNPEYDVEVTPVRQ